MSTALQRQLKKLKSAPAYSLDVERDYSSLIFDRKEAVTKSREDFLQIGLAGLLYMKHHFDQEIDQYESDLFRHSMLDFNRSTLSKEETDELDRKLKHMILIVAPYFNIQAPRQILEWLIFRYQIHLYNAETLALSLLPFHSTNTYGRLLSILKFQGIEWSWTEDFSKKGLPIPMNILVRICQSANNYYLVSAMMKFINNAIEIVGADYMDKKFNFYFTFITALIVNLTDVQARINDSLLSRIVPFLGVAIKSNIVAFKSAGLMLVCHLVLQTQLDPDIADNILKLILLKARNSFVDLSIQTSVVVVQRLGINSLPRKVALRLVQNRAEMQWLSELKKLQGLGYDVMTFVVALWTTLFEELKSNAIEQELKKEIYTMLVEIMDVNSIDANDAKKAFAAIFDHYNELMLGAASSSIMSICDDGSGQISSANESMLRLPKFFRKNVHAMAIRFPDEFSAIRSEWLVRDKAVVQGLINQCQIEDYEVFALGIGAPSSSFSVPSKAKRLKPSESTT